jgi:hypothetical protein
MKGQVRSTSNRSKFFLKGPRHDALIVIAIFKGNFCDAVSSMRRIYKRPYTCINKIQKAKHSWQLANLADILCDMTLDGVYKPQTSNVLVICPPDLYIESTNERVGLSFHRVISKHHRKLKHFSWETDIEVQNS